MTDTPDHILVRGDARRLPFADQSVDLVFGSPPYVDARLYLEDGKDLGIALKCAEWVEWMLDVTTECLRVSRGPVVWIAAGKTEDRNYHPACEGLMWEWWKRGGHAYRPCYWNRSGIPGSGGDQWFRADVEYAMCFKRPGKLAWSDNTAMGHAPKYAPGGEMSHRVGDGKRVNAFGCRMDGIRVGSRRANGKKCNEEHPAHNSPSLAVKIHTKRLADGSMESQGYKPPAIANPGTLVCTGAAGGGRLGSALAHESEAPFPEDLAKHFLLSLCPPGGLVLDPFGGSGTTTAVAIKHERRGISLDLRQSQASLARRRIAEGLRPVSKLDPTPEPDPLPGQMSLFSDDPATAKTAKALRALAKAAKAEAEAVNDGTLFDMAETT